MPAPRRSIGQGNLHSLLNLRPAGSSIVRRLATRSITGRGPNVGVHQHYGWRLHLEWETENEQRGCLERSFTSFEDVDRVCQELMRGGATGLSDCVSNDLLSNIWFCDCGEDDCMSSFVKFLKDKVNVCWLGTVAQSRADLSRQELPRYWLRRCQEMDPDRYRCLCSVTSSEFIYSIDKCTNIYESFPPFPSFSFASSTSSSSSSQNDV